MSAVKLHMTGVEVHAPGRRAPRILGPIDLELESGQHALVIGPSGSGKTTLLRAIAGLAPLSAGRIEIEGRLVSDGRRRLVSPEERQLGFVFQNGALWPHMSVCGTLAFVLRSQGIPRGQRKARIAELLALVDLEGMDRRRAATLSGGEGQRLALARALAVRTDFLLLDEPLGPIDGDRRRELLERLESLRHQLGLTLIHVTHDPQEASGAERRILELRGGRLLSPDSPAEVST